MYSRRRRELEKKSEDLDFDDFQSPDDVGLGLGLDSEEGEKQRRKRRLQSSRSKSSLEQETLTKLRTKEIVFDENKWVRLQQEAATEPKVEAPAERKRSTIYPPVKKPVLVEYTFENWMGTKTTEKKEVSKELQIKLDEELARKLQEEEYNQYRFRP